MTLDCIIPRWRPHSLKLTPLLALLAGLSSQAFAIAPDTTTLSFPGKPMLTDVPRIGLNMGGWSFYGSDQIMSNVLKNPGFEGVIDRMIIQTQEAAGRYVADDETRLGAADHFWDGASYEVVTGAANGLRGQVKRSVQQGESGYPEYTLDQPTFRLAKGDAVVLTRYSLPEQPSNWWVSPPHVSRLKLAEAGTRPGSGRSHLRMSMAGLARTEISSFLDSSGAPAGRLLVVNGPWRCTLWLKAVRGTPSVQVSLSRGNQRLFEKVFVPGQEWQPYQITFTGQEMPVTGDNATLQFTLSAFGAGSEVAVDDVYLGANSVEAFRPEVITLLQRLRPGYLRDWQGQLGDTIANRLAAPGLRKASRFHWNEGGQYHYGLDEFVDLCARIGAMPWIIIPSTVTPAELPLLADFIRKKQWQHGFHRWVIEYGNENWNGLFRPAALTDDRIHAERTRTLFLDLRKRLKDIPIQPLVNAQSAWAERSGPEARTISQIQGALTIAPYYFGKMQHGLSDPDIFANLFPDDEAEILGRFRKLTPTPPWLYEYNLHTDGGNAGYPARERATTSIAAGFGLAARALSFYDQGVVNHAVYTFSQIYGLTRDNTVDGSKLTPIWGITRDFAFPTLRPSGLAMELMNRAIGGQQYRLACQPADSCRKLVALGFVDHGQYSMLISNKSAQARTLSLSWPGQRPPARWFTLGGSSIWANNEKPVAGQPSAVQIAARPLQVSGRQLTLQIPAYGLAVITEKSP